MKKFMFALGPNNGQAEVLLSDEKGLVMRVIEDDEEYILSFGDGIFINRRFHDNSAYQNRNDFSNLFCKAFTENADINFNDNVLEITVNAKQEKTGEVIDGVVIKNRFKFLKETCAVIQETFYEVSKKRYDISCHIGFVDLNANGFLIAENTEQEIICNIADMPLNIGFDKEMILRNDRKCLKVKGGLCNLNEGILDSHTHAFKFNDDISYFDVDNSFFTTYAFGDAPVCEFPLRTTINKDTQENTIELAAGRLKAKLVMNDNLVAFYDNGKKRSLLEMEIRDLLSGKDFFISTLSDWEIVEFTQNGSTKQFLLEKPNKGELEGIGLKLNAECIDEEDRIEWSVEVINTSSQYSVITCTYPKYYLSDNEVYDLFVPEFGGGVRKEFNICDNFDSGAYPSGFNYPMPYYALYSKSQREGFYYSIHDENGSLKELYAASSQRGYVKLACRYHAQNLGECANSQILPGKAVWQCFDGDWYDATEIYREFVHSKCDWYTGKRAYPTPEWMKDIPFWTMDWVPYEPESGEILPTNLRHDGDKIDYDDWYKNQIKLRKALGVPIGFHVYNWHQIPFNNRYPHFMPARERFIKALPILKENGIRVMPYINALLWDTVDGENETDFEFKTIGHSGATKTESGDVYLLSYESRRKDGEHIGLTPMCPSHKQWRDKLTNLVTRMFDELDVDAIYLDQIAARIPHLCMDENHTHPKGGGSWWQKNYRELLSELNNVKPKNKAFTTESNAEVYANDVDGFLTWVWQGSVCDVPAFIRVYGGKVCMFGRNTNGVVKYNDNYWKCHLAKEFVCGQQMGWSNADFVHNSARLEFVKKLVTFRYKNREFFKNSIVMRPPIINASKEHTFNSRIAMNFIGFMNSPYIIGGTLTDGNKKKLILVNICDKPLSDIVSWNNNEYHLSESNYTVEGDGSIKILSDNTLECTIDSESFICIEW